VIKSELNRYQTRVHSAHAIASALALSKTTLVHGGEIMCRAKTEFFKKHSLLKKMSFLVEPSLFIGDLGSSSTSSSMAKKAQN